MNDWTLIYTGPGTGSSLNVFTINVSICTVYSINSPISKLLFSTTIAYTKLIIFNKLIQ